VATKETRDHVWKIGEHHHLHIDKIGIMHDLAMDVMMGIVASKNFVRELQTELQISAFDAAAIARDVDEEIFKPIKQSMVKLYGDGAPYKPSSSLVQFTESDEEHKELDKDALLREIENPAVVKPRIETMVTTSKILETEKEVKDLKAMESKAGMSMQPQIAKTSEAPKLSTVERAEAPKEIPKMESMMEKIAAMKLSKTFVMPKAGEEISTPIGGAPLARASATAKPDIAPAPSSPKPVSNSTPYTPPSPRSYPVDPYREPLV
jgi:carbamoylphosphate synthase large subunit